MSDQYQKEYDEAMKKLEAGEPFTSTDEPAIADESTDTSKPDEVQTLKEQVARQDKALKDTQRWGHENATKLAKLEREHAEELRNKNRPPILDANPGLEDAIRHVSPKEEQPVQNNEPNLAYILENAVPGLDKLLENEDFQSKFIEVRDKQPDAWRDPLVAIRDVTNLVMQTTRDQAVAKAQKDFNSKQKKLESMSVPGGSGGSDSTKEVNEAKAVWDLSDADFAKMRRKAMGY